MLSEWVVESIIGEGEWLVERRYLVDYCEDSNQDALHGVCQLGST